MPKPSAGDIKKALGPIRDARRARAGAEGYECGIGWRPATRTITLSRRCLCGTEVLKTLATPPKTARTADEAWTVTAPY